MKWEGSILEGLGIDLPQAVVVLLTAMIVLALGVGAVTSTTDFSPYNPAWDGTSDLRGAVASDQNVETTLVRDTDRYANAQANETVAFVVAPDRSYEGDDLERVADFVDRGGTVVVFENFAEPGNDLLEGVDAQARVDGRLLRDDTEYAESPRMPIATATGEHPLTDEFDRLTLNYATAIDPGSANTNVTVLASSSNHSYLGPEDADLEEVDDLRSYPVASIESVGNGTVVAVGDPSITVNAMYGESDNAAFLHALYGDAESVLLDYSHGDGIPPLVSVVLSFREAPLAQLLVLGSIVAACGLVSTGRHERLITRLRRTETEPDESRPEPTLTRAERVAFISERYPDWDDDRIERVIDALNRPDLKHHEE